MFRGNVYSPPNLFTTRPERSFSTSGAALGLLGRERGGDVDPLAAVDREGERWPAP
jgi:hypothetical protein